MAQLSNLKLIQHLLVKANRKQFAKLNKTIEIFNDHFGNWSNADREDYLKKGFTRSQRNVYDDPTVKKWLMKKDKEKMKWEEIKQSLKEINSIIELE